ncbi:MAG: hypothetical protein LBD99_01055 [Candidatus Margulisbacteria bacterium]|jgi:hypothetical protein|nr:hypothetical protein [Candidatus Margulisiibacteriota bacterium]
MADDSLISDLLVLGFFDKDKNKSPDKPLPKANQEKMLKKIWFWSVVFVLFYAIVCLIALALK